MDKKPFYVLGVLRLAMGWIFLWAFFDKIFGWGFSTPAGNGWLAGTSPSFGFLNFASKGPFANFYQNIAGNIYVDWIFMVGLFLIGVALILGLGVKIAGYSGALMFILIYTVALPPLHNPFIDDHIINAIVMIGLAIANAGDFLGFGRWWSSIGLVRKYPILK